MHHLLPHRTNPPDNPNGPPQLPPPHLVPLHQRDWPRRRLRDLDQANKRFDSWSFDEKFFLGRTRAEFGRLTSQEA
ncbi:hypothetical protein PENSUB_2364 [Penicillium subrubescens]|uniref:Uncharacterized protein n=1 Tax=Penicillium subrubescens TaxID=1316194 RepID=A0A1Q5UHZ1_9EURO|nr:hypothetical protein PENSUB_2364 [Penicillium subrubescens]